MRLLHLKKKNNGVDGGLKKSPCIYSLIYDWYSIVDVVVVVTKHEVYV